MHQIGTRPIFWRSSSFQGSVIPSTNYNFSDQYFDIWLCLVETESFWAGSAQMLTRLWVNNSAWAQGFDRLAKRESHGTVFELNLRPMATRPGRDWRQLKAMFDVAVEMEATDGFIA